MKFGTFSRKGAKKRKSLAADQTLSSQDLEIKRKRPEASNDESDYNTGLESLQEVIENKFAPKKKQSWLLSDLYASMPGLSDSRVNRTFDCGSYLEFRADSFESPFHLHHANFCRDRFCPMCNWRRSLRIFSQVSKVMDYLEHHEDYRYIFLTFTVKNCSFDKLSETIDLMLDGWRWLYHETGIFRHTPKYGRSQSIFGGFRTLEVTRNMEYDTFHPHIHFMAAVKPDYFTGPDYISHAEWLQLWRQACNLDYDPSVEVHAVSVRPDRRGQDGDYTIAGAIAEVSKYAVKGSDYLGLSDSFDEQREILQYLMAGLTGRRLVSFLGCFYKARKELGLQDVLDGDLVNVEDEQLRQDVFQVIVRAHWCSIFGYGLTYQTTDDLVQSDLKDWNDLKNQV